MSNAEPMRICTYPEPVLRQTAAPVENIDDEILDLIDRMGTTMYRAPGIGLAANQVGELCRVVVYDLSSKEEGPNLQVLINPKIVEAQGEISYEESCLSVVDYAAEVRRSAEISVTGFDRDGNPVTLEAEGLAAICLQHEIDHLNGVLFIDHISNLKRALYKKKLKKNLKKDS
jgi:peptide deformylase